MSKWVDIFVDFRWLVFHEVSTKVILGSRRKLTAWDEEVRGREGSPEGHGALLDTQPSCLTMTTKCRKKVERGTSCLNWQ